MKIGTSRRKKLEKKLDDLHKLKVRLRDSDSGGFAECISCGEILRLGTSNCQAGHYISKGQSKLLRWEDDNVNTQCYRCNIHKKGNYHDYRKGMIDKYGADREKEIWEKRHELSKGLFPLDWLEHRIEEEKEEIEMIKNAKKL